MLISSSEDKIEEFFFSSVMRERILWDIEIEREEQLTSASPRDGTLRNLLALETLLELGLGCDNQAKVRCHGGRLSRGLE